MSKNQIKLSKSGEFDFKYKNEFIPNKVNNLLTIVGNRERENTKDEVQWLEDYNKELRRL